MTPPKPHPSGLDVTKGDGRWLVVHAASTRHIHAGFPTRRDATEYRDTISNLLDWTTSESDLELQIKNLYGFPYFIGLLRHARHVILHPPCGMTAVA